MRQIAVNKVNGGFCHEQKKTFRLENGTEVTGNVEVYKAYSSKRNKERYLKRKQDENVAMSLDDEKAAFALRSASDVEQEAEQNIRIEILREAISELSESERKLIKEYFFDEYSFRLLAKKYGVSHSYLRNEIKKILGKLKESIINKS